MAQRQQPRNAQAIESARADGQIAPGDAIVVSFVGETPLAEPHVFVDAGRRYDWRFAADLQVCIVVREGIPAMQTIVDLFEATEPYPTLIDFERKDAFSIVGRDGKNLKVWPRARGSEPWQALFG